MNAKERREAVIIDIGRLRNGFGTSYKSSFSLIPAKINSAIKNPIPAPRALNTASNKLYFDKLFTIAIPSIIQFVVIKGR